MANISPKKEGTTQTYGQLISFIDKKDIGTVSSDKSTGFNSISPQDIVVRIVTEESSKTSPTEQNNTKIIGAALSGKESVAYISSDSVSSPSPSHAVILGSFIKPASEIKQALEESQKIDLMITLKSQYSEEVEFNNIKEVEMVESSFVYNFFIPEESDTTSQEDQSQDPLLRSDLNNVPRYVKLQWIPVFTTETVVADKESLVEERTFKKENFGKKKGVASLNSFSFKNSFEKSKKKTNLIIHDGTKTELMDVHKLDEAIAATSNKSVFSNTINAVFNVEKKQNTINTLSILKKK